MAEGADREDLVGREARAARGVMEALGPEAWGVLEALEVKDGPVVLVVWETPDADPVGWVNRGAARVMWVVLEVLAVVQAG